MEINDLLEMARVGARETLDKYGINSGEHKESMIAVEFLCDVLNTSRHISEGQNLTNVVKNSRLTLDQITRFLW